MADLSGYEVRFEGRTLLLLDSEAECLGTHPSEGAEIVRRYDGRRLYQRTPLGWLFIGHSPQIAVAVRP